MPCFHCRRIVLSEEEIGLLHQAEGRDGGVMIDDRQRGCARALVRLGYIARIGRGRYAMTAYGCRRFAEITADDRLGCALSGRADDIP